MLIGAAITLSLLVGPLVAGGPKGACGCEDLRAEVESLKKRVETLEKRPSPAARAGPAPQTAAYNVPPGDSAVLGPKKAPVSVVIFSDMQCPFCARVEPLLHEIVEDKELKGSVNVVFKHFPLSFHKDARPAAKAAMAAREQGEQYFWKMTSKLHAEQRDLTSENFSRWASEIGLDVAKFERDLRKNDAKYEEVIKADMALGQNAAKVRGTPSIFVNGWELRQRSVDGVKSVIAEKKLLNAEAALPSASKKGGGDWD